MSSEVDCANAARGVWLVKVPKYMSSRWEHAAPLTEVGRLKINKMTNGKPNIFFSLSNEVVNSKDGTGEKTNIPKEHKFIISSIANQTLSVFSQLKGEGSTEGADGKISLEGTVVQKGECQPTGDDRYMQLTRQKILQASQPTRLVKHLSTIAMTYKPVSDHAHNKEFERKKKAEGKKSREDKEKVMEMLFAAFEKHQYYNIKDLEKITRQPIPYLKEILKEICNYNAKNPHKNMWELKPEYRHYKDDEMKS